MQENLILQPIRKEVESLSLSLPYSVVHVRMARFGQDAVGIGAAATIFREIFQETGALVSHQLKVPKMNNGYYKNKQKSLSQ